MTMALSSKLTLAPAEVADLPLEEGSTLLRSPQSLSPYPRSLGEHLRRWVRESPQQTFLADRNPDGTWDQINYSEALEKVGAIAQALMNRELGPRHPVVILSDNCVKSALLQLACIHADISATPLSPNFSLNSQDHARLKSLFNLVAPKLIFAENGQPFSSALAILDMDGAEIVVGVDPPADRSATLFSSPAPIKPTPSVNRVFEPAGPDTLAPILFTSGSTSTPEEELTTPAKMVRHPAIRQRFSASLAELSRPQKGYTLRMKRFMLVTAPLRIDADDITDRGGISQSATLKRGDHRMEQHYKQSPRTRHHRQSNPERQGLQTHSVQWSPS